MSQKPYWIIKNKKRQIIWKGPYLDYGSAKTEFDYQTSLLKDPSQVKDWFIESHFMFVEESKRTKLDEEYEKF